MIEKINEATKNRPEGNRVLDAESSFIDLPAFTRQIKNEETWFKYDRNSITVFKTDDLRIVLCGLHKNAELLPHNACGIMSIQVLEGMLEVFTDTMNTLLYQGQMATIHKNCSYRIVARFESIYLLTISNVG